MVNKGQNKFCGATLIVRINPNRFYENANTFSAVNAGITSSDTQLSLFPSPSTVHLLHRISARFSASLTLCRRSLQFYLRIIGFNYYGVMITYFFSFVNSFFEFFLHGDTQI